MNKSTVLAIVALVIFITMVSISDSLKGLEFYIVNVILFISMIGSICLSFYYSDVECKDRHNK